MESNFRTVKKFLIFNKGLRPEMTEGSGLRQKSPKNEKKPGKPQRICGKPNDLADIPEDLFFSLQNGLQVCCTPCGGPDMGRRQ